MNYRNHHNKIYAIRNRSNFIPTYRVRYADDFVIITDSKEHAQVWKSRLETFLREKMRLTLSESKTLVTDVRKKSIKFLSFEYKVINGKSKTGYVPKTKPIEERLKAKVGEIVREIKHIPRNFSKEQTIAEINQK